MAGHLHRLPSNCNMHIEECSLVFLVLFSISKKLAVGLELQSRVCSLLVLFQISKAVGSYSEGYSESSKSEEN
jgi:hypothetical protein